jgi:hypothetical protein
VYVPLDEMKARGSLDDLRYLARLQSKGSFFEFLLHVTFPEKATAYLH